jgi:rhamnulokinase
MTIPAYLAFDLGAESGRTVWGELDGGRLQIRELSRFPNGPLRILDHWHWNVFRLLEELKEGLQLCLSEMGSAPQSIAVDTWGVDFGLLAPDGSVLGLPYSYRDPRTEGAIEAVFERIPRERIYDLTGIQFLPINSLFQLFAMVRDESSLLAAAGDLLFIPDLFTYLLTGEKCSEFTFATTSQLYNPRQGDWEEEILQALGLSKAIMQEIVAPGTIIGPLHQAVAEELGFPQVPVVATASHDTAAAVAAVPAGGEDWAYISSGTWSLVGVESLRPVIGPQSLELNLTNEGGVEGTFRVLKNIMGLWLLQRCRQAWADERAYSYDELTEMAVSAEPFRSLVNPDDPVFLNPPDMPAAIADFCTRTDQPIPDSIPAYVRCILESLALRYRQVLEELGQVYPHPVRRIHVVGGGCQNELLCQFTADATGLPVIAGPVEATAIGNLLVQALALGQVNSLAELRAIVRQSFPLKQFLPQQIEPWEAVYERFAEL